MTLLNQIASFIALCFVCWSIWRITWAIEQLAKKASGQNGKILETLRQIEENTR